MQQMYKGEEAKIEASDSNRHEKRCLQWYGYVRRRDSEEYIRAVAEMRIQERERERGHRKGVWIGLP